MSWEFLVCNDVPFGVFELLQQFNEGHFSLKKKLKTTTLYVISLEIVKEEL